MRIFILISLIWIITACSAKRLQREEVYGKLIDETPPVHETLPSATCLKIKKSISVYAGLSHHEHGLDKMMKMLKGFVYLEETPTLSSQDFESFWLRTFRIADLPMTDFILTLKPEAFKRFQERPRKFQQYPNSPEMEFFVMDGESLLPMKIMILKPELRALIFRNSTAHLDQAGLDPKTLTAKVCE